MTPRFDGDDVSESQDDSACRRVDLPGSCTLTIRPIRRSDEADLIGLYQALSEEDHYLRFFTSTGPPQHVVDKLVRIQEHGGFGLVAVMEEPDGTTRLVAEASYGLASNGNGELGITVAREARGWLGAFLLDALLEQAAARGVPNMEAQVLFVNRRMLSLLSRRGLAYMDHDDPAIFHLVFGTSARVPSWPPRHDRRRLLVEIPGGFWPREKAIRSVGFEVITCPGPPAHGSRCPALRGEPCPLVAGADIIVDAVPGNTGRVLSASHARMFPSVPLCVELSDESQGGDDAATWIHRGDDDTTVAALLGAMSGLSPGAGRPAER